jgi:intracellular sulfur oxidation DsrE/DsrF family protein
MEYNSQRREALQKFGIGIAATGVGMAMGRGAAEAAPAMGAPVIEPGAGALRALMERLAKAPRRRDFKTVPMILDNPDQWDHEAIAEVMAYKPVPKQVWDNTAIESPWLNLMRNSMNAQIWSFKHPDFLVVSATHGSAHLALFDQETWDKYQLTKLAGDKFKTNTLIVEKKGASSDPKNYEDPAGVFSPEDNSITTLMRRGVVFMSCHNAIWEEAGKLIEKDMNPNKLSHEALAADLTNHLIPGVVLTPGAVGTIPELQQVGFHYIK